MLRALDRTESKTFVFRKTGTQATSLLVAEALKLCSWWAAAMRRGAGLVALSEVGEGRLSRDGTLTRKWGGV